MNGLQVDRSGTLIYFSESMFVQEYLHCHKVVMQDGQFYEYAYNSGIWIKVTDNMIARRLCQEFEKEAPGQWTGRYEKRCLDIMKVKTDVLESFNTNPYLLCLSNVVFNIRTRKKGKFKPEHYLNQNIPVCYNDTAECPKFQRFLRDICCRKKSRRLTLEELMGYCLTNETKAEKVFVLYGNGSNGKSLFLKILSQLIGRKNISSLSVSEMERAFSRKALVGKKVNLQTDARGISNGVFITEIVKAISSGDIIGAEHKFGEGFTFSPCCKLLFATNQIPNLGGDYSDGTFRRLFIIPFEAQFKGARQNRNLLAELEEELPGIFNLAVRGLERLVRQNFQFSCEKDSQDWVLNQFATAFPVEAFVKGCLEYHGGGFVLYKELHEAFFEWISQQSITVEISEPYLSKKLLESGQSIMAGVRSCKRNGQRGLLNIKIKSEE